MGRWLWIAAAIAIAMAATAGQAQARPGDLDPSFGTAGIVGSPPVPPDPDRSRQSFADPLGEAPDGDVVVAGAAETTIGCHVTGPCEITNAFRVRHLRPDGSFDPAFGGDGTVVTDFGFAPGARFADAALQPDGGIVVTVLPADSPSAFVVRLTPNGEPDPTFAGDGRAEIAPSGPSIGITSAEVETQADGGIVVSTNALGSTYSDPQEIALHRFLPTGQSDPAFDAELPQDDGLVGITLLVDSQDRIVVGRERMFVEPEIGADKTLYRFLPNGDPDPSFGSGGAVKLQIDRSQQMGSRQTLMLARDEGDGILAMWGGRYLVRVDSAGVQDMDFGEAAVLSLDFPGRPSAIAPAGSGRILVAAANSHPDEGDSTVALARLLPNGRPDPAFGADGFSAVYPDVDIRRARLLVTAEEALVVGGERTGVGVAAARFRLADGAPDDRDADGVLDPGDLCPGRYAPEAGCRRYAREVTLRRGGTRRLRGVLTSESVRCGDGVEIRFQARRKGRDPVLGKVRAYYDDGEPEPFSLKLARPARGPVYAKVKRELRPEAGVCGAARSKAIRPKRR